MCAWPLCMAHNGRTTTGSGSFYNLSQGMVAVEEEEKTNIEETPNTEEITPPVEKTPTPQEAEAPIATLVGGCNSSAGAPWGFVALLALAALRRVRLKA